MSDSSVTSPLAGKEKINARGPNVPDIEESADRGMIDLRLDQNDIPARAAAEKALGFNLPSQPRTFTASRARAALWWSPDQWIITCTRGQSVKLTEALDQALNGFHAMVTNVSDARTIIRLSGHRTRETLMKGAAIDLTTSQIAEGYVRRTQISDVPVAVQIVSLKPEIIDIFVFRSYADYLWNWLARASREGAEVRVFEPQDPPRV